ncbi:unnamed protein product [Symbiodinium sp. CCMP2456]|nr:unnamed protein product [Symbiodinium sp. CCMP2456]
MHCSGEVHADAKELRMSDAYTWEAVMFEIQPFLKRLKKTAFAVHISVDAVVAFNGTRFQSFGCTFSPRPLRLNCSRFLCGRLLSFWRPGWAAWSLASPRLEFLPLQVRMTMRRSSLGKTGAWGPRCVASVPATAISFAIFLSLALVLGAGYLFLDALSCFVGAGA